MTTYITFGSNHDDAHPKIGTRLSEGYVAVDMGSYGYATECAVAFTVLGPVFAFDYPNTAKFEADNARSGYYPRGAIARIQLIPEARLIEIESAIAHTYELADGDSNDDEIEGLQAARDLLAELVGYTHKEDA